MRNVILIFFDEEKSGAEDVESCWRNLHGYVESADDRGFFDNFKELFGSNITGSVPKMQSRVINILVCECTSKYGSPEKKGHLTESLIKALKKVFKPLGKNVNIGWVRISSPFINIAEIGKELKEIIGTDEEVRLTIYKNQKDTNSILLASSIIKKCEHIHLVSF